jgi:class 3 adenylate cyclase/tetratricopeptide (TPR) repeat protein
VTVLFCDIVRSTALAQRLGPEGTHALIERFFRLAAERIHHYDGTVNQFLGDGFMALFGAPLAHEDHARRAVLAALDLRETVVTDEPLTGVQLRMGINSGEVVVGAIGDDLRMDYTAFGDTTILAHRLQTAADPDEILMSEQVASMVHGYIETESSPPVEIKERTVHPLRVVGAGSRRSRLELDRRLAPFVGRARELALLESLLSEGGRGRVVGIVGEPGLGKSRLLYEFESSVSHDVVVYEGRCFSFGAGTPYLPVLDLLRQTCGIEPSDGRFETKAKLAAALAQAGMETEAALPYLLQLLGDPDADRLLGELEASTIKGHTFEVLRELWLGLAERGPLVLVLEDLHWLDRTSEEFLTGFVDELTASPLLLLTTYRPGYAPPWTGKSYATQLALSSLTPEDGSKLVRFTAELSEELTETIVARGEGNPFFLEELAHVAVEGDGTAVPHTVAEVLAARIDRLTEGQKRTLQSAAVLGRGFTLSLLESLLPERAEPGTDLAELKRLEFLYERRSTEEKTFVFKHALTQEVAYEGLLEARRRELHACAGRAIESASADAPDEQYELLAHHYSQSDDPAKAVEYLTLANRKAAARNAMEEAVGYFYAALAAFEQLPNSYENRRRRATLVLDQMTEFHFLHRHREYWKLLLQVEPLVRELDDELVTGSLLARLGHRESVFADYPRADETMRHALEICESSGNDDDAASTCAFLGWNYHQLGDYELADAHFEKAIAKLRKRYHPISYQYAAGGRIVAYGLAGRWQAAKLATEAMVTEASARSESATVSFAYSMGAFAAVQQRDWERAVTYSELSLADAPTVYFQAFPQTFLAATACATGDLEKGLPVLEFVVPFLEQSEHLLAWTTLGPPLADAYVRAGRNQDARDLLERFLACGERGRAMFVIAQINRMLGELDAAEGATSAARAHLDRAIEAAGRSHSENELALALAGRGRLDGPGRMSDLERALEILERLGTCIEPDRLRADLARSVA